jgi:predicted transcriptional regulator
MPQGSFHSLSAAQLEILNIVWDKGDAGVAEIWAELAKRRRIARNTVQTMVVRLAAKGLLRHRQQGNAFVYSAAQPRHRVVGGLVSRLVDNAFGGSASGLVLSLLEDGKLTKREADRIRRIIDEAADRRGRKSGKEER